MISEPLYRTEIDPLEIENFAPETKIVSIWGCAVSKTEGGRGIEGGAVGVLIQKPSEKVPMILLKHP